MNEVVCFDFNTKNECYLRKKKKKSRARRMFNSLRNVDVLPVSTTD